ncbi:MAG TPA: VOC family protein [Polyangiaceae bacterium]
MKSPPKGWPRLSCSVFYRHPPAAIDWLCTALGFECRLKVEGDQGQIVHSELVFGEAVVMVGGVDGALDYQKRFRSPLDIGGGVTHALAFYVDDVDAHHARALAAGAEIFREPTTQDYGDDYWSDRSYGLYDPEGHIWFFMQRMRG